MACASLIFNELSMSDTSKNPRFFQKKTTPCISPRLPSRTARTSEMVTLVWAKLRVPQHPSLGFSLGARAIGEKKNQSFGRRLIYFWVANEKMDGKIPWDFPSTTQLGSLFQVWIGGLWKCASRGDFMVDLDHLITCHLFGNLQGLNQCGKSSHEPFSTLPLSHCHLTTAKSQDSRFNVPINPILGHEKWLMNIFSRVASITPPSPSHPFASNTSPPWPSAHQPSRRHLNVSGHDVGSPKNANASPIRPVLAEALLGSVGLGNKKPLLSQGGAPPLRWIWMELWGNWPENGHLGWKTHL